MLGAHLPFTPYEEIFMQQTFTKRVAAYVEFELENAFTHLERAHVLGQESTYWHVKVHVLMLA